jgi:hypothetical protein
MKFFLLVVIALLAILGRLVFSQSNITYDAGSSIEIQAGADVCADAIIINGSYSGGGTICQGPLPVVLSSFTYFVKDRNVTLNWVTEYELNNSGFDIERSEGAEKTVWKKIGFAAGNGTTNQQKSFSYDDKKLNTGKYQYRLKQIDYNGHYEYFSLEEDVVVKPPLEFGVSQNYPNPSNPKSKIDYQLPINGKVTIKLYDIVGREVMSIVNETKEAGYYTAEFDGANIASGAYFYRIIVDGNSQKFSKALKMILVK